MLDIAGSYQTSSGKGALNLLSALFSVDERVEMIKEIFSEEGDRIEVDSFEGLLMATAKKKAYRLCFADCAQWPTSSTNCKWPT